MLCPGADHPLGTLKKVPAACRAESYGAGCQWIRDSRKTPIHRCRSHTGSASDAIQGVFEGFARLLVYPWLSQ
jgi:hypothetical protein